jgi:hypothetical protein
MSKAVTFVRKTAFGTADHARAAIVLACAGALILAGQAFPLGF